MHGIWQKREPKRLYQNISYKFQEIIGLILQVEDMILISITATMYMCIQSPKPICLSHLFSYMVLGKRISTNKRYSSWRGKGKLLIYATTCTSSSLSQQIYPLLFPLQMCWDYGKKPDYDDNGYITFMCYVAPVVKIHQGYGDNNVNLHMAHSNCSNAAPLRL